MSLPTAAETRTAGEALAKRQAALRDAIRALEDAFAKESEADLKVLGAAGQSPERAAQRERDIARWACEVIAIYGSDPRSAPEGRTAEDALKAARKLFR